MTDMQSNLQSVATHTQLWQILIERANSRRTIRFSKLANLTGLEDQPIQLKEALHQIRIYCSQQEFPTLSAIVVDDEGTYQLSSALPDAPWERARVFDFCWSEEINPA